MSEIAHIPPPAAAADASLLRAEGVHKHYRMGDEDLHVLRGVDLTVARGEWVSIIGRSGSGKSTLLHLLGGLDRPDEGTVHFEGTDLFHFRGSRLDRYRNTHVGFVFQAYHLLPELTALQNVIIGAMIRYSMFTWPARRSQLAARAHMLLEQVGLGDRLSHKPSKLSGGERQRVAIARALINEPAALLADEPTGNLDAQTAREVLGLFEALHASGQTIVMVTHDHAVADLADRQLLLREGELDLPE